MKDFSFNLIRKVNRNSNSSNGKDCPGWWPTYIKEPWLSLVHL